MQPEPPGGRGGGQGRGVLQCGWGGAGGAPGARLKRGRGRGGDLRKAAEFATPFARAVMNALLQDMTLNGTCDTIGRVRVSRLQPMAWGDPAVPTLGFEFSIEDIKERENVA